MGSILGDIITDDLLFHYGFEMLGFDLFYLSSNGATVKICTSATGETYYINNGNIIKYISDIMPPNNINHQVATDRMILNLKAYKGDKLIGFFASELLCQDIMPLGRRRNEREAQLIVSNEFLKYVCISIKLTSKCGNRTHDWGTTYEGLIYDIYTHEGYESAYEYFKETVYKYYLATKQ